MGIWVLDRSGCMQACAHHFHPHQTEGTDEAISGCSVSAVDLRSQWCACSVQGVVWVPAGSSGLDLGHGAAADLSLWVCQNGQALTSEVSQNGDRNISYYTTA